MCFFKPKYEYKVTLPEEVVDELKKKGIDRTFFLRRSIDLGWREIEERVKGGSMAVLNKDGSCQEIPYH